MKHLAIVAIALLGGAMPLTAAAQTAPAYEQPLSAQAVHDIQARLRALGYYGGSIDGVWGSGTRAAVERFQNNRHLAVTGQLNQATVTAMGLDPDRLLARGYEPRGPGSRPTIAQGRDAPRVGPETTRAVQTQLRQAGFYRGAIDGVWGRNTRTALAEFQRRRSLPATGEPTRQSLVALGLNPDRYMSGSSVPDERPEHNSLRP